MLKKALGGIAGLGAVSSTTAIIAALQALATERPADPTWLWAAAVAFFALFVMGGLGWLFASDSAVKGYPVEAKADHSSVAQAAGRDLVTKDSNVLSNVSAESIHIGDKFAAPAKPQPSAEDKANQALEQRSYQIGSVTIGGKDLFRQVGDRLTRHRDAFLFGQEVAHALGVESKSVPEQEILKDFVMLGLVASEYHAPPAQSGPQSPIARPESPNQYVLSDLGKRVLAQQLAGGITDHRRSVTREQVEVALKRLDGLIDEAQRILDRCGRPPEQMRGAEPMDFQEHCIPRINKFYSDAMKALDEVAPEYTGKFKNVGNVTRNTDVIPAMIQSVEKWLENLGDIQDELRRRLR